MAGPAFTRRAAADLEEIYAFTLEHWGEVQADIYLDLIRSGCDTAAAGTPAARPIRHRRDGLFRLRRGSHIIVFRPLPDGALVVRVLHMRMDLDAGLTEQP